MSFESLLNDTARIFTISTSIGEIGNVVNTSALRLSTPVRVSKLTQRQRVMAGEDGIDRSNRLFFSSSVAVNQSDFVFIQGRKYDECVGYEPGDMGLAHHLEVDARALSAATS